MRILVDARTLGDKPSGVGIYLYNFLQELKKIPDLQLELLTDVVRSAELSGLKEEGITIFSYGKQVKKSIGVYLYFHFVQKMIYERKPDIFWEVNNLIPVKLKNPHGKVAVTIHDLFPISDPDCFPKYYCYYFQHGVKKTLKNADMILYDTEDAKRCVEHYDLHAAAIPNLVSYIIIDHMPKLPIENRGYFLYVGNLEKRKGTDLLLKAYRKYCRAGGKLALHLGGAVREEGIQKLLDEVGEESEGVHYLGYLSEEDKWREYAGCSAFVFPSRAEGFGMPAVEALFYRKPVILSKLAVFEEIVGKGIPAVSLGDEEKTLEELAACMMQAESAGIREQDSDNISEVPEWLGLDEAFCREIVEKYSGESLAAKLVHFWEQVLSTQI